MINAVKDVLIMVNNLLQMHLKLLQKMVLKTANAAGDLSDHKLHIKLQGLQELSRIKQKM